MQLDQPPAHIHAHYKENCSHSSQTFAVRNTRGQKLQQWKGQSDPTHIHNITHRQQRILTHKLKSGKCISTVSNG